VAPSYRLLDFPDHQHRRIEHTSRLSFLDLNAFRSIELQTLLRLTPEYNLDYAHGGHSGCWLGSVDFNQG
jgi:hypothetical protein